ncbi:MAG: alginate export family protein [Aestuariivirga sp.]
MYYGNNDAWYGRPDLMLAGNPLVKGEPAGPGYHDWLEGFVHAGLYGITPLSDSVYAYGGISAIVSGSAGQELFTDETRSYLGLEDAYAGIVGGTTTEKGDRLVVNASIGRQRFSIGDGFLIINSAANGSDRAALQSNPRWASDLLALGQVKYNNTKFEAFYFDPDELPLVDSKTEIVGANLETRLGNQLDLGATFLYVPDSDFGYFTTTGSFSRKGLEVYDARLRWQPNPAGMSGPFVAAEAAFQRNSNFDMAAYGFFGEAGYSFADGPWSPTISYRYAQFSGDDLSTSRFERWDPLFSGGTGEQWVQGINHFKVFQDSNLIAHRIQARLRPTPQIELVPQLWLFQAESTTNLGGNPALSFLGSKDLGIEVNMSAKYFMSQNVLIQESVAATFPGEAVEKAFGSDGAPWLSAMMFVRIGF